MKKLCLMIEDFFQLRGAVLYDADKIKPITKITIDSRNVPLGSLFIAIKGEKYDGHDFIIEAVNKGASAVLINNDRLGSFDQVNVPIITVRGTTLALGELAAFWRRKLKTKIIAITGSAGKTTTKEMIFTLLSGKFKVNKTLGNNNNYIGVPLTIFSTQNHHDYLVLELGTNHFGEIKYTAEIAKPDYAVITNIGDSHLEFLKNRKGVFKEKRALFKVTKDNKGMLFINNDDPFLMNAYKKYEKRFSFGFEKKSDLNGETSGYTNDGKPIVKVNYKRKNHEFNIPLYGEQGASNFLTAAAIAFKIGLGNEEIKKRLKKVRAVDKRLNIQKVKDFILINDTYNANPDSMKKSLQLLTQIKKYDNRVAILGDMFELGAKSKVLHKKLAEVLIDCKVDSLYTIGKMMKHLHSRLISKIDDSIHFDKREALKKYLAKKSFNYSIVLVKGSRGMKMEEFVDAIKSKNE